MVIFSQRGATNLFFFALSMIGLGIMPPLTGVTPLAVAVGCAPLLIWYVCGAAAPIHTLSSIPRGTAAPRERRPPRGRKDPTSCLRF